MNNSLISGISRHMAQMSRYCKAYLADAFVAFNGWPADREIPDSGILYLHETFCVTKSIYPDEGVLFDRITPEWVQFCTERLEFRVPEHIRAEPH